MIRYAVLAAALFIASARAPAAPPAGTWKMSFPVPDGQVTYLLMISEDGKEPKGWVVDFLGSTIQNGPEAKFDKVRVKDDHVHFEFKVFGRLGIFDGRVAKDGKKILGSLEFWGTTLPVELLPSKLKKLEDSFPLYRETLDETNSGLDFFSALYHVLSNAAAKKLTVEEVRTYTDKATQAAEAYGPRWQRTIATRAAELLVDQPGYGDIALEQAKVAERMLAADDEPATQIKTLESISAVLKKLDKAAERKVVEGKIQKLLIRDYADYVKTNPIKVEKFPGRKAKSDRTVLVEMITTMEHPNNNNAMLCFDALLHTYERSDVILVQEHVMLEKLPDALSSQGVIEHVGTVYGNKLSRLPTILIDGKLIPPITTIKDAKTQYVKLRELIDAQLELPATAKLQLSSEKRDKDFVVKAVVSGLEKPGEKVKLRFMLIEDRVRYEADNGMRYHHWVLRDVPGGAEGIPLTKKDSDHSVTINVEAVRGEMGKFLTQMMRGAGDEAGGVWPLEMKNLRVVALIQDDTTQEILQTAQIELADKKGE